MKSLSKGLFVFLLFLFASCEEKILDGSISETVLNEGEWKMNMKLKSKVLPFGFRFEYEAGEPFIKIVNGKETIVVNNILRKEDSIIVKMPVFESTFYLKVHDESFLEGEWVNYYKGADYRIPVKAHYGRTNRFDKSSKSPIVGKYEVTFGEGLEDEFKAIGLFKADKGIQLGTFATETGDYRHLEGVRTEDSLFLSTFDGSHAFLFEAKIKGDTLDGVFLSGSHYKVNWSAFPNETASLKNADSLTFLKKGYDNFSFQFPDQNGDTVSLSDARFENKAVIVQIMGSWCPNCLDETNYYKTLHDKYQKEGLEIVALAFERTKTQERAYANLNRLLEKTKANYPFLLAGATRETKASEALPMLNHIMSYPTSIFLDRNHEIKRIHTGFYGPSTGEYYSHFVKSTEALVEDMLKD